MARSLSSSLHIVGLLSLLAFPIPSTGFSVNVVQVPDRWRLNSRGQPRLCSAVGVTLKVLARVGLCFPSSTEEFSVQVNAQSNRAVLRGKLEQFSLRAQQSKSSLLHVEELVLHGSDLDLGWTPLMIWILPFLILLTRPPLFTLFSCWYLWRIVRNHFLQAKQPSSLGSRLKSKLGGKPCPLEYSITLSNDNLSNSSLLRHASKHLLRSLLSNSVLPEIAAVGDTAQMLQDGQAQVDPSTGQLVVMKQPRQPESVDPQAESNNSYKLTKLLSATSFDLREPPHFDDKGWMILPSQAALPNQEGCLDFVLRTRPRRNTNDLEFASPEVRLDVKAVPLPVLPKVLIGNLLPKVVWLPVGSGVALSLGGQRIIRRVGIANGACRIDGRVTLFGESSKDNNSGAIVRR